MKIRKILKMLIILFLFLSIISIANNTYAIGNVISSGKGFLGAGKDSGFGLKGDKLPEVSGNLYNILLGLGIVVVMIAVVYIGVKIIVSSAEEKADIKESLLPLIIGAFVIFGAFGIWRILIHILSAIE